MRTKASIDNILRRIMETGGLTPEMEEDVNKLRREFDERAGILDKYGETYDGEDEEYEWREKEEYREFDRDRSGRDRDERQRDDTTSEGVGGARRGLASRDDGLSNSGVPRDGDTVITPEEDWKSRYEDLRRQYLDRFFGGESTEVIRDQSEDVERDGRPQTYEDLFEKREGDR